MNCPIWALVICVLLIVMALLFLLTRPVSVSLGLLGAPISRDLLIRVA